MFRENLKRLRLELWDSQLSLSKKIGISHTTIHNMEKGASEPSMQTLLKLSKFFDISIDELVGNNRGKK